MCQAYAAEARVESWLEDRATIRGWKAHKEGLSRTAAPDNRHRKNWLHGYDCRADQFIPWCIERKWREHRTAETAVSNYETPTVKQADAII